jgi:hypothetical protein
MAHHQQAEEEEALGCSVAGRRPLATLSLWAMVGNSWSVGKLARPGSPTHRVELYR